jgi:heme/copper-type cytochrome/quinol oxidase subunit 3
MVTESPELRVFDKDGPKATKPVLPNAVLGVLLFITAESMMFAGLISGHVILKANAAGAWPPPGQPMLPASSTAFNTLLLILSGVCLWYAGRQWERNQPKAKMPFLVATILGVSFIGLQGVEWTKLIAVGLTMTSSSYGSFFYLIVGMHAIHALFALFFLVKMYLQLLRGNLGDEGFQALRLFWYFVVGLWPILYVLVYL